MSGIFLFDHEEATESKLNIDELYERRHKRDLKQVGIFNKILARIHKRIQHTAKNKSCSDTHIWFNVPEYLVGEPVYDKGECMGYLVSQLENNGFHVKYVHPNTMFVSWHNWVPSYVRSEIKKKLGIVVDEKGNQVSEDLQQQQQQQPMTAKEQANQKYVSIKNYKPSGVYGPELLEKVEKKITFG
jgi:hypothetical protein